MNDALWKLENQVRRIAGKPALPRRCCRKTENLTTSVEGAVSARTCRVCGARHFDMKADPGVIGLRFS